MKIPNFIKGNLFLKVFSFNSVIVLGKLIASFVVSKVSAIYLGPSGYAIVGNLKNVLQGVLGISASGFESGIIKYIAENKDDKKQLNQIITTAFAFSVFISLVIGLFLYIFDKKLGVYILKDESLGFVFKYLSVLLPLISLNFLIIYIVNGLQKFRLYTLLVSISNLVNALVTFLFIYFFNLEGALFASILIPFLSFIASIFFKDIRGILIGVVINLKNISFKILKSISIYIVMATYSSIMISVCYLFIRNRIILEIGVDVAGLWEAMNKISMFYMVFFSSLFTLYLLPQLAINKTISGYHKIMKTFFKHLIPITIVVFIGLLIFRTLVIKIFLTDEFESIEQYFYLQLIGDFIKIIAFSLAYQFHAKKMVTFYFIADAILYMSFYFISIGLIEDFNLKGVFYAYILSTILYLISVSLFIVFNNANYLKKDD